jgi:hypothetical protein
MTTFKLLGAAIFSTLIATSASAQHMIDEPGMFAFVYPNGDLGFGAARSPNAALAMAPRLMMRHPMPARHAKSIK